MTAKPVCARVGMTIRDVARIFDEHKVSGTPVVDAGGKLVGVVSRTDLVKRYAVGEIDGDPMMLIELFGGKNDGKSGLKPASLITIEDFMTCDPVTAEPSTLLKDLAQNMHKARVHRVIVVDTNKAPVGIVTSLDLVKLLASL